LLELKKPLTVDCAQGWFGIKKHGNKEIMLYSCVGWRHRTHTNHCLGRANPPTQNLHIQPVSWLLNTLLIPMLLYANPPYTACSPYFHIHKRQPTLHSLLSLFPYPQTPTNPTQLHNLPSWFPCFFTPTHPWNMGYGQMEYVQVIHLPPKKADQNSPVSHKLELE